MWCPPARAAGTIEIGASAPDFRLPGVDGKTYSLDSFRDAEVLVLVFTCNHCPTAQAYEDRIKQLAADYKDRKVALAAISPNDPGAVRLDELGYTDLGDSFEDMKIRAKDKAFDFPYLYDGDHQDAARAYGPTATPHVFVFDRARKLRYAGRVDNSEKPDRVTSSDARQAIEALLAGRAPPAETTKAVGCSIKWSDKRPAAKQSLDAWAKEEVALQSIDEQGVRALAKNDGKKLRLIYLWAVASGPSVDGLADVAAANHMYRRRDFELVTVSADPPADKDKALDALRKKQASATNYLFDGTDPAKLAGALGGKPGAALPLTLLVAPGGQVLYQKSGPCEPLEVRKAIVGYLGRTYK
jgi:peroxiredoxin